MLHNSGEYVTYLIGDPHLGKKFEVGVPAHRRGEREKHQFEVFQRELEEGAANADNVVMVGDLFDHPYVGYKVAHAAAALCVTVAMENPNTVFIMMAGNHDMPKDVDTVGAFDMFASAAHGRVENLIVLRRPAQIRDMMLYPWEWGVSAEDQVEALGGTGEKVRVAIGHWDLSDFGPSKLDGKNHLAPVVKLLERFGEKLWMASGHYHTPQDYVINGITVHGTGSMLPYSHAEDPSGSLYTTVTLSDVLEAPESFRDKCVRVILEPGEVLPDLDALAVTPMRVKEETVTEARSLGDFDWKGILTRKLAPLHSDVRDFITERLADGTEE